MKKRIIKHGGAFIPDSCRKAYFTKFFLFGGVFFAVAVIVIVISIKGKAIADKTVYRLPDEMPTISLPETLEDNSDSRVLDKLVVPYFNFTIEAGNHSIDVSLPIIKASYGSDFNSSIKEQLETVVSNTLYHLENGVCVYESLTYESYLDQEILTVLLHTQYTDGQSRCQPWIFDLAESGALIDSTCELAERLIGMDYSSFLWVTDHYIQNLFAHAYFAEAYPIPEAEMSSEQYEFLDSYRGIVREIPRDISNAFSRWIFPADGKVFLAFQFPVISNDWYAGFRSKTVVVEVNESILKYKDMVTPEEAVLEAVLNSTVHVMGATAQSHALLTRMVFYSLPEVFISEAASVPEMDQEYMIDSLIRYAGEEESEEILDVCLYLKTQEYITNEEKKIVESICSRIDGK